MTHGFVWSEFAANTALGMLDLDLDLPSGRKSGHAIRPFDI